MEFKLDREQRMILIQAIWSNIGEHESYRNDDRFFQDKVEERITKLKQLETLLWNGENV